MLGNIEVEVVQKDIKNLHLSVYPPTGAVRIAAPERMNVESVRAFTISKIGWIREQQKKFSEQAREPRREYLDRESHYAWGKRYLMNVVERETPPSAELRHHELMLYVRPGASEQQKHTALEAWYRNELREAAARLVAKWEPVLGVKVEQVFVQRMKTRWGSCNVGSRNIRLNTELAKKPEEHLEYVVVHELMHLLERTHNARFTALMDRYLPRWRMLREELNRLPVSDMF